MFMYVLGAPGSGKSTVLAALRTAIPSAVVLDWDAFMDPAGTLAGRPIAASPGTWTAYQSLVRAAVDSVLPNDLVLLGVCTPSELTGWPIDRWLLLDCADDERCARLGERKAPGAIEEAMSDAASYRRLGLPRVDTTTRSVEGVAEEIRELFYA